MAATWFITGTDTNVGKTWFTLTLLRYCQMKGWRVAGMKPIASGSYKCDGKLRNRDAEQLWEYHPTLPYEWVNPYCFIPPIAPHLAAKRANCKIELSTIIAAYHQLAQQAEIVIIEGVGGWRVPLNEKQSLKDLVQAVNATVILVVGLRLGCINHALLTAEAIINDGCLFKGWVANPIDFHFATQESIETLQERMTVPLLAQLPYLTQFNSELLVKALNWSPNLDLDKFLNPNQDLDSLI